MKISPPHATTFQPGRHLEVFDDPIYDPYLDRSNFSEPSACTECGAVYRDGRWQWVTPPVHALRTHCPACRRIEENAPAAYVSIDGEFAHDHRKDIISLARLMETYEKAEHPLERIMHIEQHGDRLGIATTDIHMARAIGEALEHTYMGQLDFNYTDAEYLLRVSWRR
jgi:hypothetical protein